MTELKECTGDRIVQSQPGLENNYLDIGAWQSNIHKLYLVRFFMGCHLISGVLIPFFLTWGKLTFIEVMFLQSYFTIMILIFEIPCGAIADYISRKLSLILGGLSTALAALVYASYPNIVIFAIGETLFALGNAFTSGTDQAFSYDTLRKMGKEEEISKVMARNRSYFLIGVGISAPIGSIIGVVLSLSLTMSFMFFPFILATFISLTLKEPNHDLEKDETENYFKIVRSGFKELTRNSVLRIIAIDLIMIDSVVFFIFWMYQLYLEQLGFQLALFGLVAAVMTIVEIIFTNLVSKLEKRYKNKKVFLQFYTMIPGIGFILMATIYFVPVSIALILIVIGFGISRDLLLIKGINKQIETNNRATVLSTINMIGSLLRTVLYPVIGFLVMWNLSATFILLGSIMIIVALLSRIKDEYLK
ncbi:MAG: MFS transporter [Promethearchaeota archaeon]